MQVERGWVQVDETYRTAEPNIYAVGDAIGGLLLAHVAAAEGYIAAEAIAGKDAEPLDYSRVPRVTYSRPQVAAVGLTEAAGEGARPQREDAALLAEVQRDGADPRTRRTASRSSSTTRTPATSSASTSWARTPAELISEAALARFLQASAWELGTNIHPHPSAERGAGRGGAAFGRDQHLLVEEEAEVWSPSRNRRERWA